MKPETLAKIKKQQGREHSPVWHAGEHVKEFLEDHPRYEEIIAADLDNPEMGIAKFEKAIHDAANRNGGGIGGRAADAVLRKFFGLPETDGPVTAATAQEAPLPFDFASAVAF